MLLIRSSKWNFDFQFFNFDDAGEESKKRTNNSVGTAINKICTGPAPNDFLESVKSLSSGELPENDTAESHPIKVFQRTSRQSQR